MSVAVVTKSGGAPASPAGSVLAELERQVVRARRAQPTWASLTVKRRGQALRGAAKAMLRDRHRVLELIREESGKLEVDALMSEALGPLDQVNAWTKLVARALRTDHVRLNPLSFPNKRANVRLVPRGVVGTITPWNYPLATFFRPVLPALLSGNAVIIKPSELTPRTAEWFVQHLQAHLPSDVVQLALGDGSVGEALIAAGIDACTFTGSVRAGRRVAALCAERMIPVNIEMGGKDVAIVLDDCDLARTAAGVTHWALHNAGQACSAIEVACVHESIADAFIERLASAWSRLKTGPGEFARTDVSPLSNEAQLQTVERHVQQALAQGAKLRSGGHRLETPLTYAPTLLDHCTAEMSVVREETFGPVLACLRVRGSEDAVRLVNDLDYGLTASLWTADTARAERLGERLNVGVVTVNNHSLTGAVPGLAWSGTRQTGFGVSNHALSLATFCRPLTTLVDHGRQPEPFWLPYDPELFELGDVLSELQLGQLLRAWKLPKLLRQRVRRVRRFFE